MRRLRSSEWLLLGYFLYVALVSLPFGLGWKTWAVAAAVALAVWSLALAPSLVRDLAPLLFILAAYREMDWFTSGAQDYHLETIWVAWDRLLLTTWHLRAAIESAGRLLPFYLESCYTFMYVIPFLCVGLLYWRGRHSVIDRFWMAVLSATLLAYALFPFFPSSPPWAAFPGTDLPSIITAPRLLNRWLTGNFGIHSSVFPSAHVATALACAWGLLCTLPKPRRIVWLFAVLGFSIAVAAVYGRYHYAVDVVAGMLISLVAFPAARLAASFEKPE